MMVLTFRGEVKFLTGSERSFEGSVSLQSSARVLPEAV